MRQVPVATSISGHLVGTGDFISRKLGFPECIYLVFRKIYLVISLGRWFSLLSVGYGGSRRLALIASKVEVEV